MGALTVESSAPTEPGKPDHDQLHLKVAVPLYQPTPARVVVCQQPRKARSLYRARVDSTETMRQMLASE